MFHRFKSLSSTALGIGLCLSVAGMPLAWGAPMDSASNVDSATKLAPASNVDIGTVKATTTGKGKEKKKSAYYQAPSKTPLHVSQPTSVVDRHYIKHNVAPTANYDTMVTVTPSVTGVSPNGPGLAEDPNLQMRGFQDGQYNVTFDGMPWGDSNDFTHHSTSYFMAHDLTQATVNRGPGTAANVGEATFGGTIALHSKDPSAKTFINPYATIGSWNTKLYGIELNTGMMPRYHNGSALFDFEKSSSDGYLTHSGQKRANFFTKFVNPISDNTTLTVAGMYNQVHQYVPAGKSKAQIAQHGWNWGLSSDPTQENYYGYNYDKIHTDFEYIVLQSYLGNNWSLDNKLYTFGYYHHGYNGNDPSGLSLNANGYTYPAGSPASATDPTGQRMLMNYRSFGDFFRMAKDISIGTINLGVWYEHQYNDRFETDVNWALNGVTVSSLNAVGSNPWNRLMHDTFDNVQPYAELAWKVTPRLTVTPGVKYAWFQRHLNAQVNQSATGAPLNKTASWSSVLPALDVHYKIQPGWVAYLQVAKGFLAPNLNTFYYSSPNLSSVKPEKTWNYQIGTTWKSQRLTLSADAYYIDFNNLFQHKNVGAQTLFYNAGGVIYKGLEAEGTVYVGDGFSLFANGSINSAKDKTNHQQVAYAPESTAAGGIIYNDHGWYGSLIAKHVGKQYGDTGLAYPISGYTLANAALSYTLKGSAAPDWMREATVNLQVHNVFNKKTITNFFGNAADAAGTALYWTSPERSYFMTVSAKL